MEVLSYIVGVLVVISVLYSLYHCASNKRFVGSEKAMYVIVIIVIPVIGMVIYFKKDQQRLYHKRLFELQQAKKELKRKKK